MIRVDLPWPPSALRPNASSPGNWRRKSEAARRFKTDCAILCRAAGLRKIDGDVRPHLTLRYCPPTRARYDMDNNLAATKAGIDAISDAIGVDDHLFDFTLVRGPVGKPGRVEVTITAAPDCGDDWQSFGDVAARVVDAAAERLDQAA